MALIEFENLPSTATAVNANNLNNNFNEVGKSYSYTTTPINGSTVMVFYRVGHLVEIFYNGDLTSFPTGGFDILNSFPAEYRPYDTRRTSVHRSQTEDVEIIISPSGTITAYNYGSAVSTASNFQFNITYIV